MTRFVLATGNPHKVGELQAILGERLGGHEIVALGDVAPDAPEPVEDGIDFAANALIKARAAARATGLPALADDSGIAVRALRGAPGIHSARYAGTRDDGDNLRKLLLDLRGAEDRTAAFVCAAALVDFTDPDHPIEQAELGEWAGEILTEPVGLGGFGYDPVFRPAGEERSAAELSPAEKNAVSHRARAFGALVEVLRGHYG